MHQGPSLRQQHSEREKGYKEVDERRRLSLVGAVWPYFLRVPVERVHPVEGNVCPSIHLNHFLVADRGVTSAWSVGQTQLTEHACHSLKASAVYQLYHHNDHVKFHICRHRHSCTII